MSASTTSGRIVYCRFDDVQLAQLTAISQLEGSTVNEVVRLAVRDYLQRKMADGSLKTKAEAVKAKIQQEATEQLQAIDGILAGVGSVGAKEGKKG
jgi:hypothetical protein